MVLVVADQAPVQFQGSVGLLAPPTLGLRHKSLDLWVEGDDLDVDAQTGAVRDDLTLEALVDESSADCAAGQFGDLVQQDDARRVVVGVRGQDDDRDDQSEDVHRQTRCRFAPFTLSRMP